MLKIGQLSQLTQTPVATLRFYADQGLLPSERGSGGYRYFAHDSPARVRLIRNCRAMQLSLEEVSRFLAYAKNPGDHCSDACRMMEKQLDKVREQKAILDELESDLQSLLRACRDKTPRDCCQVIEAVCLRD